MNLCPSLNTSPLRNRNAFSLLESLFMISVVGVIMAFAIPYFGDVSLGTKEAKLMSDVATMNKAVKLYLANGGNLDGLSSPQEVIDKLKTSRANSETYAGLSGSMIDARLEAKTEPIANFSGDQVEWIASSGTLRASFDGTLLATYTGDPVNTFLNGRSDAFLGFTGSTGELKNKHAFKATSFTGEIASTVNLADTQIKATDPNNTAAELTFTVSGLSGGRFEQKSNPGLGITTFTQKQIDDGEIQFVVTGGSVSYSLEDGGRICQTIS